ncbi:MAG TPA: ion channel [Ignavibacteria bacterium]|nr:ion channel [Ignavibacteria bacterium]HRB01502.1 ion channel [Ignavibacteria bacterium]
MNQIKQPIKFLTDYRGLQFLLFSVFLLLFVIFPVSGNDQFGTIFANLFFVTVLIFGLLSIDLAAKIKKYLFVLVSAAILTSILGEIYDSQYLILILLVVRLIYLWILVTLIFIKVFKTEDISFKYRITGSITIYLLLGFIWANFYYIFYKLNPGSFKFSIPLNNADNIMFNFIYFSFETLTTLGLGDILPVLPVIKLLVILEGLTGPLYLAILIGRMISVQSAAKK